MLKKLVYLVGGFAIIDFVFDRIENAVDWVYEKGFEVGYDCAKRGMDYDKAFKCATGKEAD